MMTKTALIILNYNNFEDTINCISSVEKYNTAPIKYIIVDNGSTRPNTVQKLHEFLDVTFENCYRQYNFEQDAIPNRLTRVSFIVSELNDGYAQGNNKGLAYVYADDEISDVMILNNDILFVEDIIPQLLSARSKMSDPAIISPVLYKKDMVDYDYNCARLCPGNWEIILTFLFLNKNLFYFITHYTEKRYLLKKNTCLDKPIAVELPSGSCMLIEKEIMNKIGGFDPHTFLYYEENILFKKMWRLGLRNYVLPNSKCIHMGAVTTSKSKSFIIQKSCLNSASYYLKNYANMTVAQTMLWACAYQLSIIKIFFLKKFK